MKEKIVIIQNKKSKTIGLILTFLFGPIGLFYATILGGVIMTVICIIISIITFGFGVLLIWPVTMIWAYFSINNYNNNIENLTKEHT